MLFNRIWIRHLTQKRLPFSTSAITKKEKSDNEKDAEVLSPLERKKAEAVEKLQNLLLKMANENQATVKEKAGLNLAKPVKKVIEKRPSYKIKLNEIKDETTVKLVSVVKDVADAVGGDVIQTESELLHLLLNNKDKPSSENINDVIGSMTVDKNERNDTEFTKAERVKTILSKQVSQKMERSKKYSYDRNIAQDQGFRRMEPRVNLYSGTPLNIFTQATETHETSKLETWDRLEQKELRLLVTHPARNIWEEMIQWTNHGKLWHFPINNEQGLDHEFNVDFTQHVFLEEHLDPWCPKSGPIRHFMELVCVGLSKNPYITVEAKRDHILWFRDYFEEKKKLLLEVGALGKDVEKDAPQIESNTS